jgi:predicted ArsR family transcriptional regulator
MNSLQMALMYWMVMQTNPEGESVIGRNQAAGFIGCTVVTAGKHLKALVDKGLIEEHKKQLARGVGYKYVYHVTMRGTSEREMVWIDAYNDHRYERLQKAMEQARRIGNTIGGAIKRHPKQMKIDFGE